MWWICFPFHLWRRVQTEGDSEGTISIHLVLLWWSSPRHVLGVPLSHAPRGTHTFQPFSQRRLLAAQSPRDCCSRDSADQGLAGATSATSACLRTDNSGVVLCSPESRSLESDYELYQHATDSIDYARCAF